MPFGLALIDASLPGVDGLTLAGRIRQRPELAGLRLLLLTSGGKPGDLTSLRAPLAACLAKPIMAADLLEAVGTC